MTPKEKMEALEVALSGLAKQLEIPSMVVSVSLGGSMAGAMWIPGCGSDCKTPHMCAAKNFIVAGTELEARGIAILSGDDAAPEVTTASHSIN